MSWHHRTVLHKNKTYPNDDYLTVHEFSFCKGRYTSFTFSEASPRSKQEAKWIFEAFKLPPVVEVDDSTSCMVDCEGNKTMGMSWPDYDKWNWIRGMKTLPKSRRQTQAGRVKEQA